ncbi:hypothetical protein TEA_011037 [Camellia sinensis var. sinensis]|uniref:Protein DETOXIFICATION n=1 Tax=Camellia sinensis var. sinensis TaxID=542762 RepID=A0A4S4DKH0_CAMSN|nr:hypothetical protein TEA_011037 [Camellia sinensis var. sinensis]
MRRAKAMRPSIAASPPNRYGTGGVCGSEVPRGRGRGSLEFVEIRRAVKARLPPAGRRRIPRSLTYSSDTILELWYNSVLILVAGYMSNAEVAISAFSICLNISAWEFMLCLGFLGAACVRVANELGRGDAKAAKFSIKVILWVAVGAGLQSIVAGINLCCFYVIGIPIGVLLAYVADLEVKGLWIGMTAGVVMQVIALSFMVWRTDWDEQVNKASERLGRWFLKPSEESDEGLNHS